MTCSERGAQREEILAGPALFLATMILRITVVFGTLRFRINGHGQLKSRYQTFTGAGLRLASVMAAALGTMIRFHDRLWLTRH